MPEEFDLETFDKQVDQVVNRITTTQSDALIAGLTVYYKAGSDDIRPSSRLTNVQKNAIKKLSAEHFGYISEFNNAIGDQIKDHARQLLKEQKGYAEISTEIKKYASDVFGGTENVVIDNVGKTKKVIKVGKDGKLREIEHTITKPYTTNTQAYSDMLAKTSTHTAWEQGRASEYQRIGMKKWRFVGPSDERARPDHVALLGQVFEYGTPQSDYALQLLQEPNCRHRQIAFFDDMELDTPQEFFEKQKQRAGLQWDNEKGWTLEKTPNYDIYKEKLTRMSDLELSGEYNDIIKGDIKSSIVDWYHDSDMSALDGLVTKTFNLDENSSRITSSISITKEEKDKIMKSYDCVQEYMERKYPGGTITLYRGVGGDTYEELMRIGMDKTVNLKSYNLSCWSESEVVARGFTDKAGGGCVLKAEVPIDRVFLHYDLASAPHIGEMEITLMGDSTKATIYDIREANDIYTKKEKIEIEKNLLKFKETDANDELNFEELFGL